VTKKSVVNNLDSGERRYF